MNTFAESGDVVLGCEVQVSGLGLRVWSLVWSLEFRFTTHSHTHIRAGASNVGGLEGAAGHVVMSHGARMNESCRTY